MGSKAKFSPWKVIVSCVAVLVFFVLLFAFAVPVSDWYREKRIERLQKKYEVIPQIVRDGGVMGGYIQHTGDYAFGFKSEQNTFSLNEVVLSVGVAHYVPPEANSRQECLYEIPSF